MGRSCYDITVMVGIWHLSSTVKIGEYPTNISSNSEYEFTLDYIPEDFEKTMSLKKYKP